MAKTHAEIEAELITVGEIKMNLMSELADAGVCFEPFETEDGTEIRVALGPRKANAKIKASLDKLCEIDQRYAELWDDFREISARNAEPIKAEPPSRLLH